MTNEEIEQELTEAFGPDEAECEGVGISVLRILANKSTWMGFHVDHKWFTKTDIANMFDANLALWGYARVSLRATHKTIHFVAITDRLVCDYCGIDYLRKKLPR